jgi:guanylate kinase
VGKSTVVRELRERHPEVWLSVSATTRRPRPGERDGVHYFFVDDAAFDDLVRGGHLLEWAEFAGNRYGTPANPVTGRLDAGVPVLLEIDLQGLARCARRCPTPSWSFSPRRRGTSWSAASSAGAPSRRR